jgi:hypothetical protein
LANGYIAELSAAFNTKKEQLIRLKSTTRPYLSVDKLREALVLQVCLLTESADEIKAFVERVKEYNKRELANAALTALGSKKNGEIIVKAADKGFMLAVDPKLPWIKECLKG